MIYVVIISISLSIMFGVSSYMITRRALASQQFADDTFLAISKFREHLQSIYELELFYGDETLNALLEHTRDLEIYLSESQIFLSLSEEEIEEYVNRRESTPKEEAPPAPNL